MKRPKKPTLNQKKAMKRDGLNWKEWMVASEEISQPGPTFKIYNRITGKEKEIETWNY